MIQRPGSNFIVFDKVSLVRGGRPLFVDFSLTLAERRIALIGNNGAGKSSLLRLANGLLLPDRGSVTVHGLDTATARNDLPGTAGFMFQNPDHQIIFPTVGEEIGFGFSERGLDRKAASAAARDILVRHDRADWFDRPVHELSEGQKQLVCLMAVTAMEPSVLLLDEPFAGLDLPTRLTMMRELDALPQQIVMATHDLDLVAHFERAVWLDDGRIRADGRPADVAAAYRRHCLPPADDVAAGPVILAARR